MIKMKLHLLLAERGLSQKDIADVLDIPKNTVSKYVNNTFNMINKQHLDALCRYFNCEVDDLVEYKQETYIAPNQLKLDLDTPSNLIEVNPNEPSNSQDPTYQFGYYGTGTFIDLSKEEIDNLTEKDLEDIHAYLRVKNMLNLIKHHNNKDNK